MSANSLTGSPSGTLKKALGVSLGSLADEPNEQIVLTKYAHILPESKSAVVLQMESAFRPMQLGAELEFGREQTSNRSGSKSGHYKASGNKLWSISGGGGGGNICALDKPLERRGSELFEPDQGEPFEIVWTDLSFQVDLSSYHKIINRIFRASNTFGGLSRRASCRKLAGSNSDSSSHETIAARQQQLETARKLSESSLNSSSSQSLASADKRTVFEQVNGYVSSGEITAILGPSGAGKTSLLNAICGRTKNYAGQIRLRGGAEKQGMRLSIIPQKDYLIENLSVRENLLYSSKILNPDKSFDHEANIMRVVKMLNLTACFNSIAANISGGEYKRVSIAQELLRQPDILILDEPTSGLDSLNCKNLIRSLAALIEASRRGQLQPIAIVMSIHQPDVDIFHMFDHVYCLARGGRVIFDGHPRDAMRIIRSQAGLCSATPAASATSATPATPAGAPVGSTNGLQLHNDMAQEPFMSTTNPANLLIEIASEQIYGQEPIERLAKFQRKQFEQANGLAGQQLNQLQKNLLAANSGLGGPAGAVAKSGPLEGPPGGASLTPNSSSSSSSSLASSCDGKSSAAPGAQATRGRQLVRDKRLQAKHDHSGRFWYHTRVLAARAFVSTLRDPLMTLISFIFHLSIPFVMWTVYPKRIGRTQACPVIQREMDMISMASNKTADRLEDLQEQLTTSFECSTMFFLTTYSFSMCSLTVASLAFPLNMHILLKEVRNGWYNLPAYVLAKTLANFPFEVLFPVISLVMIYLMLGMPSSDYEWRLAAIALVMALISMISNTQGLIFGALCMDSVQTAIFLASASSLPQTLLSGFTARIKYMPSLLQRISWLSQYRYSSDLINMIRFGFGICPCDQSTDDYLRNQKADFKDVPDHLKPIFTFYLAANNNNNGGGAGGGGNNTESSNSTMSSVALNSSALVAPQQRIPGIEYDLMLSERERNDLLNRMETGELDLFARMAEMTGRSFTYGRPLEGCQSVRSQLLITAGTPTDDYLPLMFGCMFALLLVCKIILFFVVRNKIGSRV